MTTQFSGTISSGGLAKHNPPILHGGAIRYAIAPYENVPSIEGQEHASCPPGPTCFTRWLTAVTVCFAVYCGAAAWNARALPRDVLRAAPYPVRMTQLEYIDPSEGGRPLNLMLIYRTS
jgi:hypothetical protein